jgi:hypothetical protein
VKKGHVTINDFVDFEVLERVKCLLWSVVAVNQILNCLYSTTTYRRCVQSDREIRDQQQESCFKRMYWIGQMW